ncbi:hypothetical protein BigBertha_219 [Bacillus phage BigBertha]|uniref:Transmembrane protein n=2 Tax=Caudoviricetes TaxID=2731619 RepID=U5PVV1_9CAUD|nr:hypothetical protein BigBertha_219 [Bacillus phage BigBertha]AGY46727.1 hypothetical protein BigBertha_219 [Bacillus phage BigBertha]
MKISTVPAAVISTLTFTTMGDTAYAETVDTSSVLEKSTGILSAIVKGGVSSALPTPVQEIINWLGEFVTIIKTIPTNVAKMSADLLAWIYELCTGLILQTPLFLFDNEWFTTMSLGFSGVAVGIVVVLTIIECIKRMLSGASKKIRPMEFTTIMKRWSLVAGVTSVTPFLFKSAFRVLNFISGKLTSMGSDIMTASALTTTFSTIDIITLLVFDAILISTVIPMLWTNGRRFFDLLVLGVVAPVALSCWVFDSHRHFFQQWWSNVKHLSLVQVYHSLFLLIIGLFIFGIPFPMTFTGTAVKLLVVIGGFARMQNPPKIIANKLDNGKGLDEVMKSNVKETSKKLIKNFAMSKSTLLSPLTLWNKLKK